MTETGDAMTRAAARVWAGEERETETLAALARAAAVRMVRPLVDDPSAVDDVAQEAVMEMLATLHRLREPAAFVSWFRLIVRKQADRHRRRQASRNRIPATADHRVDEPGPADIAERRDEAAAVRAALLRARDPDRTLLGLRYFREWTDQQLADVLGITEGAVRKRLFDARRRLRPALSHLDTGPRAKEPTVNFDDLYGTVISLDDARARVPSPARRPDRPRGWLPLLTGWPVLDVLNPLPRGGIVEFRSGSLYLLSELIGSTAAAAPAVMVAVGVRRPNAVGIYNRFQSLIQPPTTGALTIVVDERKGRDVEAVRAAGALAAAIAGDGVDVLLAVDFVISEAIDEAVVRSVVGLVGRGSVTALRTSIDPGTLERIASNPRPGSTLDLTEVRPLDLVARPWDGSDAVVTFSTPELVRGLAPPVDLEQSFSKVLDNPDLPAAHAATARAARQRLAEAAALRSSLSQSFDHGDDWTGHSSPHVPLPVALRGLEAILAGAS